MSEDMLRQLLKDEVWMPFLMAATVVVLVLIRSAAGVMKSAAREKTRREIAAYIAEGSMSPEQGERLMRAGKHNGEA